MTCFSRTSLMAVALFAALSSPVFAESTEKSASGPRWACWYSSEDVTIRCLLVRRGGSDSAQRGTEVLEAMDSRLPAIVRTIWGNPERFVGRYIRIPMWNVPYEMDRVRELAESVICGIRSDCSVVFDENADDRAPVRAAAMEAGVPEDEVMAEVVSQGIMLAAAKASVTEEPRKTSRRRRAS